MRRPLAALAAALGLLLAGAPAAALTVPPALAFPRPPPPDMTQLPGNSQPSALPGVQQVTRCVQSVTMHQPAEVDARLWGQRMFRLPELWRISRGASVRIAVIDTGVASHPQLAGRLYDGGDFVAGESGTRDCEGHGTAVAGIAAAAPDPVTGFAGVAPAAQVIAIRQTSESFRATGPSDTSRPAGDLATLARAVKHAVDLGADVINISEVACADPGAGGGPALRAAIHYAVQHNTVVVAAAGNVGDQAQGCPGTPNANVVPFPAWFGDEVLSVGAIGAGGSAASFTVPGPWVSVAAPGEGLVSLSPNGPGLTDEISTSDVFAPMAGTSFAAPAVAGLAALIRARYPNLTALQVINRITATASQHAAGHSDTLGYGTVDPVAALARQPEVLAPPQSDPAASAAGRLDLAPVPHPPPTSPSALWAGTLALLATAAAAAIATARVRTRP